MVIQTIHLRAVLVTKRGSLGSQLERAAGSEEEFPKLETTWTCWETGLGAVERRQCKALGEGGTVHPSLLLRDRTPGSGIWRVHRIEQSAH